MTLEEFQKKIVKTNWFDKYYYYLISFAVIAFSLFLFYDFVTNPVKYKGIHSVIFLFSFLFLFGCYAFYLVPKRYKILSVDNNLNIENKKKIISKLLTKLNISSSDNQDSFYSFKYQRKWWTPDFDVYLNIDNEHFYVSVLASTHYKGGFIDFGASERLKRKIAIIISSLLLDK